MRDATNGDLVPVSGAGKPPADPPADLAGFFGAAGDDVVCSFNLKSAEGRQLMQKCEEEPDRPVRELANVKLRLRHVYAKRIEVESKETGEMIPGIRICLVTTAGQVHACVSEGVRQAVGRLIRGHGLPPWQAGIPCVIALKSTKHGHNWLTVLEDFETPKGGAK